MVKFSQGKNAASNKAVIMSRKLSRSSTSTNDVSQRGSCNESDILLTTFGPSEINQYEVKEVEHQGEFINFKIIFQHDCYSYKNTNFPS